MNNHDALIRDQFTKQAEAFATAPAIRDEAALSLMVQAAYKMNVPVKGLLERSFPRPGDEARIRALFEESLADDDLGVDARRVDGDIRFDYPIMILVADR